MTGITTDLYFEAHVTVEPLFDDRLEKFKEIVGRYQFRVADLLMKKRSFDTPARSQHDSFCTGRGIEYADLSSRMLALIADLQKDHIHVWRYKIENTLEDSSVTDTYGILVGLVV